MNNLTDNQFSTCTPEEEEFFQEIQARKESEMTDILASQRNATVAAQVMRDLTYPHFLQGNLCPSQFGAVIYAAIRDGKVPGVILGERHGS